MLKNLILLLLVSGCAATGAVGRGPHEDALGRVPHEDAPPKATLASNTSAPRPPPNVCLSDPAFKQFDFWLGAWSVSDTKGVKQGDNIITKVEADCLIVERWTSVKGNTGQSYNFYDPVVGKWRQVWVSRGMVIDYEGGLREDGAMVLQGEVHYHAGQAFPFRGTWSKQDDGTVRQHFEQFDPKTKRWADWFTGIYQRTATP